VQVNAGPVMLADPGAPEPRAERLGLVRVRAFVVERDAVVDPLGFIERVQRVPSRGFVGHRGWSRARPHANDTA
jgi:hypothetical protein